MRNVSKETYIHQKRLVIETFRSESEVDVANKLDDD